MKKTVFVILGILAGFTSSIMAQETKNPYLPDIHGTIRAKYEYGPTIVMEQKMKMVSLKPMIRNVID